MERLYREFLKSTGICTDSRRILEGSLFFALKGEVFDGNLFVEKALEQGCRMAVCERRDLAGREDVIQVPSVLQCLQDLAHFHRGKLGLRVLAITGSNGKTTTKELTAAVLAQKLRVAATRGNLNNHIGVPLTLLSLKEEEVAVVEMGANHAGEIAALAQIAAPDLGMITNIGKAHLEGFGSLEGVLNAKSELYRYLASHDGKALMDGNDPVLNQKARECGVPVLGIHPDGAIPVRVDLRAQHPYLEVDLHLGNERYMLKAKLVGSYNLQNIKLAAGCGLFFGVEPVKIAEAIEAYLPENQRSQWVHGEQNQVVLDAYNANPSSMREALRAFMDYSPSPRMAILGDMAELGPDSASEHRSLLEWVAGLGLDRVLLVGRLFSEARELFKDSAVFSGTEELELWLEKEQPRGFHVLLKGSRVMKLETVVPLLLSGKRKRETDNSP